MCRSLLLAACVMLTLWLDDGATRCSLGEPSVQAKTAAGSAGGPLVLVGIAKIDLTPSYPVRLTGYGSRQKESEGVAQKIWAKALVIGGELGTGAEKAGTGSDDEGPALLLTADNCGIQETMVDEVARRLADKAGLKRERIVCCSSHTHSAPAVTGFAPLIFGGPLPPEHQQHIERYTKEVIDKLTQVALEALAARRPARLSWGAGTVGFAMNRRPLKNGLSIGIGEASDGPVDHRLPVLAVRDEEGKLLAVVADYACHCTTLGGSFNQVHGDWAGFAQEFIEADHPGAIALQTIGCGGDANPHPRGSLEICRQHGRELADEVNRLLQTDLKPLDGRRIRCAFNHIDLPLGTLPTREQLAVAAANPRVAGSFRAKLLLEELHKGQPLATSIRYPVATWTWGNDLAMVFLGGEVVVDYVARLSSLADRNRLWITAYANDVPCYIASKRVLREGGYEPDVSMAYYGWPTRLAPQDEDLIVDAVQQQLPPQFLTAEMQRDFPPPKSPAEGLASIHVPPGLKVELVASEPLVVDPIAFDWGPDGRLWVVEMRDYPNGMDGKGKPGGRIKVLESTRGDGHYDKATVFLDDIPFPTGIKVWRKGVLVAAAPLIFYAEDTTGNGRADRQVTLYEGFGEGNQQHRVNGLRWGIDNWLYVGNGNSGGKIKSSKSGQIVDVNGRDLRIRPDDGQVEAQSGQTQYGICRDDWGSWFGGDNSQPFWHYVLDDHYLRRNPHFIPPTARKTVPVNPGAARVYPLSRTLARFNDFESANHFTSACSPELYRDHWLGERYYGNSFVCEPVHNLIHRELVTSDGPSFTSRRADDELEKEFLASTDNWFRPVMVRTGPDGALWVADMYRFVIEHPQWIPEDWQRRLDVRAGADRGRIYRVVRADAPLPKLPRLDGLDTAGLVAALENGNGPVRDMTQQMLLWGNDPAAAGLLVRLAEESKSPLARLHALATLNGLNALAAESLTRGLRDPHPGVRRLAIKLRDHFAAPTAEVNAAFWELARDVDPLVRMQFAYSLGSELDRPTGPEIGAQLLAHADNAYLTAALLSSLRKDNVADALSAVAAASEKLGGEETLQRLLAMTAAFQQNDAVRKILERIVAADATKNSPAHFRAIHAVLQSAARQRSAAGQAGRGGPVALDELADAATRRGLTRLHDAARRIVASTDSRDAPHKAAACLLLAQGLGDDAADLTLLSTLMRPGQPSDVQSDVVEALADSRQPQVAAVLLAGWSTYAPSLRSQVFAALLSRDPWVALLLDRVEQGQLKAADFDARSRADLAALKNRELRSRAEKLLAVVPAADRKRVIEAYQDVLHMTGDADRGKQLFTQRCSQCHFYEGIGHRVGPELASVKDRSPASLLVRILDPNAAVESRYLEYRVELLDGRVFSGIIAEESTTSLTLIGPEEKRQAILRSDIESITSTRRTLMPEGFEKDLKPQDVADIIAFVGKSEPPRQFAGNAPAIVRAEAGGTLNLAAAQARIFGPRLIFETKHQNLGWWMRPADRAEWTCEVPAAGTYRVLLDYACAPSAAGNEFVLKAAGHQLRGTATSTGTWDDYRQVDIGQLDLPAGQCELSMQSAGPIHAALFDLRTIVLTPIMP
jgi:putative membrane-bound dehydrogenase-like protein